MILVLFHSREVQTRLSAAAPRNVLLHPMAEAESLGECQRRGIGAVLCEWGDATPPAALFSPSFPGAQLATLASRFRRDGAAASRARGYAEHFFFPLPENFFEELEQGQAPPRPADILAECVQVLELLEKSQDYAGACHYAAERMRERLAGADWSVHLRDRDHNWTTVFVSSPSWKLDAVRLGGCLQQVEQTGQSALPPPGAVGEENLVCLPLVQDGSLTGALCFPRQGDKAQILGDVAAFLGAAFHHIDLLIEKQRLTFTDTLTSLYNTQYLRQFLMNELLRCSRYHKSVSILFIDIDWFKQVNDNHGHVTGSDTLVEIGRQFSSMVRASDVVVRYGGDEFVIVLTETALTAAEAIAERVRKSVATHVFGRDKGRNICVTVSIGVAGYPNHGSSVDELIRSADTAMYQAKSVQKNKVKAAD